MAPDGDFEPVSSLTPPPRAEPDRPTLAERIMALLEVLICSDYPTQLALAATFAGFGYGPFGADGKLSLTYVVLVSLTDTVLLLGLIVMFMSVHRERPRDLFFGGKPIAGEALAGLPLIFAALAIGIAVLVTIQLVAPRLHTVAENPLQNLVHTPRDVVLFAIVVFVAGGIREEIQRAFLLRRFERWLGGPTVGIVVTSVSFGAGHLIQGVDAAIATGALGAFWAYIYLRRRSIAATVVSHSGFNLLELVQLLTLGR